MNSTQQTVPDFAYVIALASWLFAVYIIYQRNLRNLKSCKNSRKVTPNKVRFILSWFVYTLMFYLPWILIVWFLGKEFPGIIALGMLIMNLSMALSAYPYYTIAVYKSKINGATRWGWRWKRVEIMFNEINVSKTLRQPGNAFGITTLYSTSGVRILTLGLTDQQISNILKSANGYN
jgi:hypothetical protein